MEKRPSPSDYSGDMLTLRDIGIEAQTPVHESSKDLVPNNVVELRQTKEEHKPDEKKKPKAKALILAGAALLGSAKLAQEAFSEKIHPAQRIVQISELDSANNVEVDDIKPGSSLEVSPFSYTITGGNVRTSPGVQSAGDEADVNLVQHTDLSGKVIAHPIEVADKANPSNGNWYVFFDSSGAKYAVNEQNVSAIADPNLTNSTDITVTVDRTTNMGIIAHDSNNISMQVATVVDTQS